MEGQQGTKSYYDSVSNRRYVTLTPGDAGINARSHIMEVDPDLHLPTAAYYIAGLDNRTSLIAINRWLYMFNPIVANGTETAMSGARLNMDTKVVEYISLTGTILSYPAYSNDAVPGFFNGTDIIRWAYRTEPNTLYKTNLLPIGGSGTLARPWILNQSTINLPISGIPNTLYHYTLQYDADWKVLLIPASSTAGYWALRF